MEKIQVYISGNYKENEEDTFNYSNRVDGEHLTRISKSEALEKAEQDIKNGLMVSYPSDLGL